MEAVTCPGCLERDQRIAALERRVAELEALVRDFLDRIGTNATNSGTPPSANPPQAPKPTQTPQTRPQKPPRQPTRRSPRPSSSPPPPSAPRTPAQDRSLRPEPLLPL